MGDGDAESAGDLATVLTVFDDNPIMLCCMEGPDHRFIAANKAAREFLANPDLVGMTLREAAPEMQFQQVNALVERVYRTGRPESGLEWRLFSPTAGEWFATFTIAPRRDASGAVTGAFGYVVDVTAQVRARQAAQDAADLAQKRYEQTRDLMTALQRELLPAGVPVLPTVDVAASYLLADVDTAAGGDWFDALALPGGRLALIVGDVVGHGVTASAAMGQLRAVLRDRLRRDDGITSALAGLDQMAGEVRGADAATVCVVVLDPDGGGIEYCTAGHPPPLVVSPDGRTRYLPPSGGGPLGSGAGFGTGRDRLGPGELVLLYSDGIIERPGRDLAGSTVELAQVAADVATGRVPLDGPEGSDRVCTQIVELLVRATGHSDDITLLAARRTEPIPDLDRRRPATPSSLRELRIDLGGWLRRHGVTEADLTALQHATGELVTNAIEHAYTDMPADAIELTATLTRDGVVQVAVSDRGRWHRPVGGATGRMDRGLGLSMTSSLVDSLDVRQSDTGTTVELRRRPTRPARLLTDDSAVLGMPNPAGHDADPFLVLPLPGPGPVRLRVDGPVDAATAAVLDQELSAATHGGTTGAVLDLTGVTHLASAGVAVLTAARRRATGEAELRILAPPGSPAGQILTLVQIPHDTVEPSTPDVDS